MRPYSFAFVLIALLCPAPVAAKPTQTAKAAPLILTGDNQIIRVINGKLLRFQVDPGHPGALLVNAAAQTQTGLKSTGLIGIRFVHAVGPVRIAFGSGSAKVGTGRMVEKRRVLWSDTEVVKGFDGVAGPNALRNQVVTFALAPITVGEREINLPLAVKGIFGYSGAQTQLRIGQEDVPVSFSLLRDETLITAPTGALLATSNVGTLSGVTVSKMIRFGIERPVRQMNLGTALLLGDRPIPQMFVRISDFGDASSISDGKAAAADQDEIIVTARGKKKPRYSIVLGRSFLVGCSSLTYDFPAKLIRLRCLNPG